jgi:transposase-like protein
MAAAELEAGRSIEAIAREVGRAPSTVAYWVNRYGLTSTHAHRHAARGPLTRDDLESLIAAGMTVREIARELDRSPSTVRHWLRHHGLRTQVARRVRRDGSTAPAVTRDCPRHGWTTFRRVGAQTHYRCARCVVEAVSNHRRNLKEVLIADAGGCCTLCGYDRCRAALQFHHLDPSTKLFEVSGRGVTRSLERAREEARKCVLLCANCHAEVESGSSRLPVPSPGVASPAGSATAVGGSSIGRAFGC